MKILKAIIALIFFNATINKMTCMAMLDESTHQTETPSQMQIIQNNLINSINQNFMLLDKGEQDMIRIFMHNMIERQKLAKLNRRRGRIRSKIIK